MQDDVTWKISLLMDDELPPDEAIPLLEQISRDPQLQVKWYQYQLIRQALRSGYGLQPQPGFLQRVQSALASEVPSESEPQEETSPQRFPFFNRWLAVPVAVAAAVVAVALLLNREQRPEPRMSPVARISVPETQGGYGGGETLVPHHYSRLEDYLLAHSEGTLYLSGPQHMLSYARIVTHGGR